MNRYHDKRRKIEYRRITKMLQIDNGGGGGKDETYNNTSSEIEDEEGSRRNS